MSSSRIAAAVVVLGVGLPVACGPASPAPAHPSAPSADIVLAAAAASAPAPRNPAESPATSASAASSPAPRHTPHRGPLPEVPAELVGLRDVLKDLGQLQLEDPPKDPRLSCKGCVADHPEMDTRYGTPPVAGSFTGPGKKELVLDARGECGVQGHQWGCLLLVGDGPDGREVIRFLPARAGSTSLRAHRVEGGRDLLVGLFAGWQQGGRWSEAFAIDFRPPEPVDTSLASVFVSEGCGEASIGLSTSNGEIDKVVSRDENGDGVLDVLVSGAHGEIVLKDPLRECRKPKSPVAKPFTVRLLRSAGSFVADDPSTKLAAGRARLTVLGVKGIGED